MELWRRRLRLCLSVTARRRDCRGRSLSRRRCEAASVGVRPDSRRAACREELRVGLGYCGGDTRWLTPSDLDGETADEVVDAVLRIEGLDPARVDPSQRTQIMAVVDDWLFAPSGRGQRSGLPR